jgi:FdrA protein
MVVKALIKPGEYHDSISLMLVARSLSASPGVRDSAVVMATEANKSILSGAGMLTGEVGEAGSNDLVIVVQTETEALAEATLKKAEDLLKQKVVRDEAGETRPRSIRGALALTPNVNVAVISVAGRYAAHEAWQALEHGLHVFLFSDHVSLEDEIALKQYARAHGLLLMGPGAGTAIINGVALGFADAIPAGPIGIVSAAGTGLQEVSTLIARAGGGISQAIGVGGRDLSAEVGGIMMLEGLKALQADAASEAIALISKPPAERVANLILEQVSASVKPTVICFLGGDSRGTGKNQAIPARTLQEAALLGLRAAQINTDDVQAVLRAEQDRLVERARGLREEMGHGGRFLRGLFSGGTLCYEAQMVWRDALGLVVHSNAPLPGGPAIRDSMRSEAHTAIDMGEEEFTQGRLHPMMDQGLRIRRLLQEARDPETAVILLDVVLGYGAHPDPASELGPAVEQALDIARGEGRGLCVLTSVTGTDQDPQCRSRVVSALERSGAIVCDSNAAAARLAGLLV